jgi:hypothetical protein
MEFVRDRVASGGHRARGRLNEDNESRPKVLT